MQKQIIKNQKQDQKQIEQAVLDSNGNQINLSKQKWSKWTDHQMLKYCIFINIFQKQYSSGKRRPNMLFKLMAKLIKTKNISQCRTFTYKMQKQYSTFQQIVNSIQKKHQPQNYSYYFEKYKNQIFNLMKQDSVTYKNYLSNDINEKIQKQGLKRLGKQYEQSCQKNDFVNNYPFNSIKNQSQKQFLKNSKSQFFLNQSNQNIRPYFNEQQQDYFKNLNISNMSNEHMKRLKELDNPPQCINEQMRRIYQQHQIQNAIKQRQMMMKQKKEQISKEKVKQYSKDPFILSLNKNQIINQCNIHWNQWLKYSLQLDALQRQQLQAQNKNK